jgi:Rrf2 family nitric oxide-sensitive transcriptional repressor
MRLNQASDFALRILMLLATEDEPLTVEAVATRLQLVKSHVMKIVARLGQAGLVDAQRGRNGGLALGRPAQRISVGEVVRLIEADFAIVECMRQGKSNCTYAPRCALKGVIHDATDAFLEVLDSHDLASLVQPGKSRVE